MISRRSIYKGKCNKARSGVHRLLLLTKFTQNIRSKSKYSLIIGSQPVMWIYKWYDSGQPVLGPRPQLQE